MKIPLIQIVRQFDVRAKSDWKWRHCLIFLVAWIYTRFAGDAFYENYVSVIGSTVYVPDGSLEDYRRMTAHTEPVYRHEYTHLLQSQQEKWYRTKYLLSSRDRLLYECEAYCHNLAHNEDSLKSYKGLPPDPDYLESVRRNLKSDSIYHFYAPYKLRLDEGQRKAWDMAADKLVNAMASIVREPYHADYLGAYGRLDSGSMRIIRHRVDVLLRSVL